jgi:L-rhamnose isomerase
LEFDMTETSSDPFEIFNISKELLTAEQKLLPSGQFFERFVEVARNVTQAQIAYAQALMRANAALLGALLVQPGAAVTQEERPSVAARETELIAS